MADVITMGLHLLYAMVMGAGCLAEWELGHFSGSEIRRQLERIVPTYSARKHQQSTRSLIEATLATFNKHTNTCTRVTYSKS